MVSMQITRSLLPDDQAVCRQIARRHARTFTVASQFLPPAKRRAALALYAFCRMAQDRLDAGPPDARPARLHALAKEQQEALRVGSDDPVLREVAWAAAHFDIAPESLGALLKVLMLDVSEACYASWDELRAHCHEVASTVGATCAQVFGLPTAPAARAEAMRAVQSLGVAMQLTAILRDVGDDARRGRCRIPTEDLARVSLTRESVLQRPGLAREPRWRVLMALLIGRARTLHEAALPAIRLLAPDAQRCVHACALGSIGLLDAIERANYDTLTRRVGVGALERASLLLQVWRRRPDAVTEAPPGLDASHEATPLRLA